MDDYEIRVVPVEGELTDEARDWQAAGQLGFNLAASDEQSVQRWWGYEQRDAVRLAGAYPTRPVPGLPALQPVATYGSFASTLNVGGAVIGLHCVTDVTVRTTHRRRGLLRAMLTDDLRLARERGFALAALTASEGSIYGRFGFGIATHHRAIEVETGPRFVLDVPSRSRGSVEIVDAAGAAPLLRETFGRFHRATRGSIDRPSWYDDFLTGLWDFDKAAPNPAQRVAARFGADGRPDAHVVYTIDADAEEVKVRDLVAAEPDAELALWAFLGSVDLTTKVTYRRLSPTSPLPWALAEPRVIKTTALGDFLWLRVLDVPAALAARAYEADGEAVFGVTDELGFASGTWRLVVRDGRGHAEPTDAEPPVVLQARALGSAYLGGVDLEVLAAAGQAHGDPASVSALAGLLRCARPAYCLTGF